MAIEPSEEEECVLVVEDEEAMRETLREVVAMGGCSVLAAKNGVEALKLLAARRPCLVIVDLLMPVMGGVELIEKMQSEPSLASIPILISTAAPQLAPPGLPVVEKPIDLDRIWDYMRKTCRCSP
jgi:two-component system, chemotaxis family, chemotaxis protein CheY